MDRRKMMLGGIAGVTGLLVSKETLGGENEVKSNLKEDIHTLNVNNKARINELKRITDIQCMDGNWDHDPYMQGVANGLILAEAIMGNKERGFIGRPKKWLDKKENQFKIGDRVRSKKINREIEGEIIEITKSNYIASSMQRVIWNTLYLNWEKYPVYRILLEQETYPFSEKIFNEIHPVVLSYHTIDILHDLGDAAFNGLKEKGKLYEDYIWASKYQFIIQDDLERINIRKTL